MSLLARGLSAVLLLSLSLLFPAHAQSAYFFPATPLDPDPAVPTPEQFLGYPVGSRYTRHDELVAYFEELARVSPRVKVERIGRTYEGRPLLLATITDPDNHANLESLRQAHNTLVDPSAPESAASGAPVVVWLAYSVHGAETSSAEAALLTAWFLAADRSEATRHWLREAVVLMDPAQNPDGRDRAANWHNAWGSNPPSPDPADREHVEPFPGGRFNHYLTDLNRDWLALAQADSVPKVEHFHRWYPNVQIDFHEMGKDSTYYFEPSPKSMESPLLPGSSYEANKVLARYHAQALDAIGSLYYSGENYDNFSPIYGSTYPDFHGGVGATVEQASSRGRVQETVNGPLEFRFTIRNHLNVGLATVRGAVEQKAFLFRLQKDFFRSALEQAGRYPVRDWVFGDRNDPTLSRRLLSLLLKHRIEVRELSRAVEVDGKRFEPGSAWVVPARQPAFRLAHAIFEFTPPVKGDVFYSGTSYAVAPAYGLRYAASRSALPAGARVQDVPAASGGVDGVASYAYALDLRDYGAYRLVGALLAQDIRLRAAFAPLALPSAQGGAEPRRGVVPVPGGGQPLAPAALHARIDELARSLGVRVQALASGKSEVGIDLGSDSVKPVRKPGIALVMGQGVSAPEIGAAWHAFDTALGYPTSKIEPAQLGELPLERYTTIVMASGNYAGLPDGVVAALKRWIAAGGSLVAYNSGARWAIDKGLAGAKLREAPPPRAERLDFGSQREVFALRRVSGNILSADVDLSHPLAFGLQDRRLLVNKETGLVFEASSNPYLTVVRIDDQPRVNGYLSEENLKRVAGSAFVQVVPVEKGNVVVFADDPAHRKYWHGTERLLLNAALFSNHLNPIRQRGE
ncbi:M14 family metallopeptidase [Pseudoxanthomonas taiwanensis]|uniref:Zinc carboxypeptidase n=1 Tax=Pseudoxanthomonas taiwanensis J19 TaxID=935569 RepID=A0A562E0N1_9GAMM|nr:M14 family metallopeptidase [Pseudoxanthomonas taiwanensis]TWH15400.1 zinc carboxypeptidase [Pseudoxanthomonas taiwanensis J19]